jgi:hypothetical protein
MEASVSDATIETISKWMDLMTTSNGMQWFLGFSALISISLIDDTSEVKKENNIFFFTS